MQTRKEIILAKLKEIHDLEKHIGKRIFEKSLPAKDADKTELSEETINKRIETLAESLINDYPNADPVLIGIMNGALPFASKLNIALEQRKYNFTYDTMQVSSYKGTQSTGTVTIAAEPKTLVGGKMVIFVDDVCDTGKTCEDLKKIFFSKGATHIIMMVLVDKVQQRNDNYVPEYAGFKLSKEDFIIGMGLDFDGGQRNLLSIRTVDPKSLPSDAEEAILEKKPFYNTELQYCIKQECSLKLSGHSETLFTPSTTTKSSNVVPEVTASPVSLN
jgi:hypoxanthine phosphoribosyltransferase